MFVPIWVWILVACAIGWCIVGRIIGPGQGRTGDYGWDIMTLFIHGVNTLVWLVVAIIAVLTYFLITK